MLHAVCYMKNKGFTLIELLVTVAIMGLLASIVLVSMREFRAKARDSRRVVDMKSLRDALALYQVNNGVYPSQPEEAYITGSDSLSVALKNASVVKGNILDPLNISQNGVNYQYSYQSLSNGKSYVLEYCLETAYIQGTSQGCGNEVGP